MFDHNRPPSPSQLRWFGLSLSAMLCMFAVLAWWRFSADTLAMLLLGSSVALGALYYGVPKTQKSVIRGFRLLTLPLQWTVSFVLLACLYYLIMTPTGLLLRLFRRDPLDRHFDREAPSYWEPAPPAEPSSSYFRQF